MAVSVPLRYGRRMKTSVYRERIQATCTYTPYTRVIVLWYIGIAAEKILPDMN